MITKATLAIHDIMTTVQKSLNVSLIFSVYYIINTIPIILNLQLISSVLVAVAGYDRKNREYHEYLGILFIFQCFFIKRSSCFVN